ncbi:MAG: hypothetical protein ACK5A0_12125, partial [Polaromonas sp.]
PHKLLKISSCGSPACSGPGLWGCLASLLHKPDRLLAKNRTNHLLLTYGVNPDGKNAQIDIQWSLFSGGF